MSLVTFTLNIQEEQRRELGEDAALRLTAGDCAALIACMDGCGGSGGRRYPQFGGWSGAKISACLLGNTLAAWFWSGDIGAHGTGRTSPEKLAERLRELLDQRLKEISAAAVQQESMVVSRLSRTMPSTLAAILVEAEEKNRCRICSFWAGDSRTYFFPVSGLRQTSRDDIRGRADPFDSLINDGILSNVVSADRAFQIHAACTCTEEPCMVLTATDGCFSYFPSPLSLEQALLETLMASSSPLEWETALRRELGAAAGDDYTLQLAVIGFSNYAALQTAYAPRWEIFQRDYAEPLRRILETGDTQGHRALWRSYQTTYLPEE